MLSDCVADNLNIVQRIGFTIGTSFCFRVVCAWTRKQEWSPSGTPALASVEAVEVERILCRLLIVMIIESMFNPTYR
jgi:hypothetical protein